jgi:hypothetical protein
VVEFGDRYSRHHNLGAGSNELQVERFLSEVICIAQM